MRLDPASAQASPEIGSESDFFQRVKKRTLGVIGWERIEPSNESGYPDTHFVIKSPRAKHREGTVEFKFVEPDHKLRLDGDLVRGTQKAGLIEYAAMGGSRRFFLVYHKGSVWLYNTSDALHSIRTGENKTTALGQLEEPAFASWLMNCLEL